ncbi:hypothetical protein GCM10008967_00390 [Bacillus carboniphilus]|uniref:Phage tail tape measure protein domain-containing protein n=2 Tax=Bacillati TaxID=1783272 RepID=A0ABN0VP93_9BACI
MTEEVGTLRVSLSLEEASFTQSVQNINRKIKALNSEFNAARAGNKEFDESLEGLRFRSQNLSNVLNLQREKVEQLKRQYEQSASATGQNSRQTENLLIRYNQAVATMRRTESQLEDINTLIEEQSDSWRELGSRLDESGERMRELGQQTTELGDNLTTKLSLPIAAFGGAAFKSALDFDLAAGKIQAQLGLTADEAEKLNKIGQNLWENGFGENIGEAGAAVSIVARNMRDIPIEQLEAVTENALTIAETFEKDVSEVTRSANQLMKDFGLTADQAFDYITKGFQKGLDYSGEFLDVINEYSPQFKALGFSGQEFFNTLAAGAQSGAFNLDKVGDAVKEFNIRAKDGSDLTNQAFEDLNLNAEEMSLNFAKGGDQAQKSFKKVVQELSKVQDPLKKNEIGVALFGTQFEDLEKDVIAALGTTTDQFGNVEGATKDAGKAMYDNFGTRLQSVWRDLQKDMLPVGNQLLDIAENILPEVAEVVTNVTDAFNDLSPEGRNVVLTLGGIALAAGPVLSVGGRLITGFGSLTAAIGTTTVAARTATGVMPLLGVAMKAALGPIGLVISAVGLVAGAFIGAKDETKAFKVSLEDLAATQEEVSQTDQMIERFDNLQSRNRLTNDEMLKFLDLQAELERTSTPSKLDEIKVKQEELIEKSGLTNDEMQEFVDLNGKIIEMAPETQKAISSQGIAYAENTDAIRAMNQEQLKTLKIEAEQAVITRLEKEKELREENKTLVYEMNQAEEEQRELLKEIEELDRFIKEEQERINKLKAEGNELNANEIRQGEMNLEGLKESLEVLKEDREVLNNRIIKKAESIGLNNEELQQLEAATGKYEEIILGTVGLNAEKGKGLETLTNELYRLQEQKNEIDKLYAANQLTTFEYNEQITSINGQIEKLKIAKGEMENINLIAGETVYKDVIIEANLSYLDELERQLSRPVYKPVITRVENGPSIAAYADGTDYHPYNGLALVGEEGPELVYLPKGAQVFTATETKGMLNQPKGGSSTSISSSSSVVHNRFNITIPASDLEEIRTINDFFNRLEQAHNSQ